MSKSKRNLFNFGNQVNGFKLYQDEAELFDDNYENIVGNIEKPSLRKFILSAVNKAIANVTTDNQSLPTENERINDLENQLRIANQNAADLQEQLTNVLNSQNAPDETTESETLTALKEQIQQLENTANENAEIASRLQLINDDLRADNEILKNRKPENSPTPVNIEGNNINLSLTDKEEYLLKEVCERLQKHPKEVLINLMFVPFIYNGPMDFFKIPFSNSGLRKLDEHYKNS